MTKSWDSIARRYVEHDLTVVETFGAVPDEPILTKDIVRAPPPDCGLREPVLAFGDTFSAEAVVLNHFFPLPPNDNRRGDWMQTFTGLKFWPIDPRPDDVDIRDIAHSLSMQCRYGGHSLRFYSVAEHSVLIARAVAPENALWALLHDASEAYLADVPRPLKRHLAGYKDHEARVMGAVCDHFDMPRLMPAEVHDADNRILGDEIRQNMAPMPWHAKHDNPLCVRLEFWSPAAAELYFLDTFRRLVRGERLAA